MINFRVENLLELLNVLRQEGVIIVSDVQEIEYGKFGWVLDQEGNKIELWQCARKLCGTNVSCKKRF